MAKAVAGAVASGVINKMMSDDEEKPAETTSSQRMDPELRKAMFGAGGIFDTAKTLYNQNPSGMNDAMRMGINTQRNLFTNPDTLNAFQGMLGRGAHMLGEQIAGNPFTQGTMWQFGGQAPRNTGIAPPGLLSSQPNPSSALPGLSAYAHQFNTQQMGPSAPKSVLMDMQGNAPFVPPPPVAVAPPPAIPYYKRDLAEEWNNNPDLWKF